ncbi:PREDICTED: protein transport protein Sec24B-like [Priapulus caudatus]|uniref:Protein transport protein Sec24B-like n=1 Tax=Priapulus caudatus TaxID=37621 RepID=A0ABM1F263_PRICU|nr:PREDICTED: protein transport protein Sec24B-like [Priapulus caudatus]
MHACDLLLFQPAYNLAQPPPPPPPHGAQSYGNAGVAPTQQQPPYQHHAGNSVAPSAAAPQLPHPVATGYPGMQAEFGRLGIEDNARPVNLLQEKVILPTIPLESPRAQLQHDFKRVNCNPDIFRCTVNSIPQTQALLSKSKLPLGILIHPFKDLTGALESDGVLVPQPAILQLSSANIDRHGVYVMDVGECLYVYVGRAASDQLIQDVFARESVAAMPEIMVELPELANPTSERLRNFITYQQSIRPHCAALIVLREDSKLRGLCVQHLYDDRSDSTMSYYEFLQHIQQQTQPKMPARGGGSGGGGDGGSVVTAGGATHRASISCIQDVANLGPANDFYKKLSLECSGQQVAVDLFLINGQYSDIATLGGISKFSSGCMHYYPGFHVTRAPAQAERLENDLRRYLTRKMGFEAVMRIRCTRGMSIHTFHGNFFVRSTDLLSLPNINPDAGFADADHTLSIDDDLKDHSVICFQAALLYTSSRGERRIRVHTMCLPTTSSLTDVYASADQQAIVGLVAKMAVDRSLTGSLKDSREAFINVCTDVVSAYGQTMSSSQRYGTVTLPYSLRLLPLLILALLKNPAFRLGQSTKLDHRVFAMNEMKTKPLRWLMLNIYPRLYAVHNLTDEVLR